MTGVRVKRYLKKTLKKNFREFKAWDATLHSFIDR